MSTLARTTAGETRDRIMDAADKLFRRLGYAKTAVADIAADLDMSPANIYRFFPSKLAIVEAMCKRCLNTLEEQLWSIARSRAPAAQRLERLVLEGLAYHKENHLTDQRVNDIVLVAMQESWDVIKSHKDAQRAVLELVLRDGIDSGEFEAVDPRETAETIMRAMIAFCHPVLIAQGLQEGHDLEYEAQRAIRFLIRSISTRR